MKKLVIFLFILIMNASLLGNVFFIMDIPYSVGVGYSDQSNFIKISDRDIAYSYNGIIFEKVNPFFSANMKLVNPAQNNDIQIGTKLLFDNFDIGIGLWSSFSEFSLETGTGVFPGWNYWSDEDEDEDENTIGHLGTNVFFNGNLGKIIFGVNLTSRVFNVIQNEDGLNFIFNAFPTELAKLRSFSGYLGFNLLEHENFDLSFYFNFPAYYSIVPGGMVFFKMNSYYTFTVRLEILNF